MTSQNSQFAFSNSHRSSWAWKAPLYSRVRRLPVLAGLLAAEQKQLAELLRQVPQPIGLHLDVGSGTGDTLALFQDRTTTICVDASRAMLRRLPHAPKLQAHAESLPFANQTFDFVSALGVLEYVPDARGFFEEMRRVLQPQRCFLFTSSPLVLANYLRQIWGERLYLRSTEEIARLLSRTGWQQREHARTWLQEQWLARRE
ncbi:MAG: methyltransferase domain-containing protein [bacterium]